MGITPLVKWLDEVPVPRGGPFPPVVVAEAGGRSWLREDWAAPGCGGATGALRGARERRRGWGWRGTALARRLVGVGADLAGLGRDEELKASMAVFR
jgi:hypothetical protein